jgi:glutamine synthetase
MSGGERLRLVFCDHLNLARSKYVPASKIGDGSSRFCQGVFANSYAKDLLPAPGSKMLEGLPDMDAVYKAADIRNSWHEGTKIVIGDLYNNDGTPLPLCGRGLLKRTIREWQELGYTPKVGLELEAYAFHHDEDGKLVPYDTPGAYVYSTGRFADPLQFTDAIWETATAAGFRIDSFTSEYDAPQFEFTLTYDDALKAVDDIFLFRLLAREVALDHGIILTFMPKPILNLSGSGLHVNFSFLDKNGKNAIGDDATPEKMPDLTRGCIAGLMHHHAGMAGLLAPSVNSFDRLKPASLSGFWRNWGLDHRGVTTRLSAEGGTKSRIEHRMGDGAANPYTMVATTLQAAKLGFLNKYDLPAAETADCLETQDARDGVAADLSGALNDLVDDKALVQAVGAELVENHVFIKRHEVDRVGALEGDAKRDYYIHYI